eukprot:GHVR01138341.1.p1 GENE.GHVR01138341.1~~GHVR01138341.1.p1  ORF type:complete len:102 (+),score=5.68 GHVR01138341.1:543-848(+)
MYQSPQLHHGTYQWLQMSSSRLLIFFRYLVRCVPVSVRVGLWRLRVYVFGSPNTLEFNLKVLHSGNSTYFYFRGQRLVLDGDSFRVIDVKCPSFCESVPYS